MAILTKNASYPHPVTFLEKVTMQYLKKGFRVFLGEYIKSSFSSDPSDDFKDNFESFKGNQLQISTCFHGLKLIASKPLYTNKPSFTTFHSPFKGLLSGSQNAPCFFLPHSSFAPLRQRCHVSDACIPSERQRPSLPVRGNQRGKRRVIHQTFVEILF